MREVIVFSHFSKHLRDSHFSQYSSSAGVVDFLSNKARSRHFWKLKNLFVILRSVSDKSTYSFANFYVQKWSIVATIRVWTASDADLKQVCILDSGDCKICTRECWGCILLPWKFLCCLRWRVVRYRLERADFESEIDSELDTGPTTFCCVPRLVF